MEKLDTTYQFFARDPKDEDFSGYEIPNIEERVEPMTREAILALMEGGATAASASANPVGGEGDDDYPF